MHGEDIETVLLNIRLIEMPQYYGDDIESVIPIVLLHLSRYSWCRLYLFSIIH